MLGGIGLASALLIAVGPVSRPTALAAPESGCPASAPAAGVEIAALPWAQERHAVDRINPLANGLGVTVAVIDSGVDAGHPQLVHAVTPGRDLLDPGGPGTIDCVGHGTAVASIIAARPAAGIGFRGLAPAAKILPVRVSERQVLEGGTAGRAVPPAGLAEAVRFAVARGARVINLSIVLHRDDPAVRAAIRHAIDANVIIVAAAGNSGPAGNTATGNPTPYPAAYDGVLGVGASGIGASGISASGISASGISASGSDSTDAAGAPTGSYVDIVAPGMRITAAARVRGHGSYDGASFAAPFVSATAALLRQRWPHEPAAIVVRRILATADPAPDGPGGYGVLNPYRAVAEHVANGEPDRATPLPDRLVGPAEHTRQAEHTRPTDRTLALRLAVGGGAAALGTLVLAAAAPRARRRRWRPGPP